MSESTETQERQETQEAQETHTAESKESEEVLALPAPSDYVDTETETETHALDFLGPIIVNTDGTMGRIPSWASMPEAERAKTFRLIGARNKRRTDALKESEATAEAAKVEEAQRVVEAALALEAEAEA
jgi:hypothetical protein